MATVKITRKLNKLCRKAFCCVSFLLENYCSSLEKVSHLFVIQKWREETVFLVPCARYYRKSKDLRDFYKYMLKNSSRFASLGFNNILKHICKFGVHRSFADLTYSLLSCLNVKLHEANLVHVTLIQYFPKSTASLQGSLLLCNTEQKSDICTVFQV